MAESPPPVPAPAVTLADSGPTVTVAAPDTQVRIAPAPALTATGAAGTGPVDALLDLGAEEIPAGTDPRRGDALRLRLALLSWDGRADPTAASEWLDGVRGPAAFALRRALALAAPPRQGGDEALAALSDEARTIETPGALDQLGELVLWRSDDPGRAAELLTAAAGGSGKTSPSLAAALALAGRWEELADRLERSSERSDLNCAAAIAEDRLDDRERAERLLGRAAGAAGADQDRYLVERLLERSIGDRAANLRLRLALLEEDAGSESQRAATRYEVARALSEEERGTTALHEAAALLGQLPAGPMPGLEIGAALVAGARIRVASVLGDWVGAARAWTALAELSGPAAAETRFGRACLRRAAELLESRIGDVAGAEAIHARLHSAVPGDADATESLVRLLLGRGAVHEVAPALLAQAGASPSTAQATLLRAARAAEAAEARRDPTASEGADEPPGLASRQLWASAAAEGATRETLEASARALRRDGAQRELARVYGALAPHLPVAEAAAHLTVGGALLLERGSAAEADELLHQAIALEPDDLLAHAARAWSAEAAGRRTEHLLALARLIELAESPAVKAKLLRRHAALARGASELAAAQASYQRALELEPDEPATLYALSSVCEERGDVRQAVELRERAAALSPPALAATWLCEIGGLEMRRLGDDAAAQNAFERALDADPDSRAARAALVALHRKHRRFPELVAALRRELRYAENRDARLALQLDLARTAEAWPAGAESRRGAGSAPASDDTVGDAIAAGPGPLPADVAIEAYRDALRLDGVNAEALIGVERLCRRERRWAELAEILVRVPQVGSAHTLHVLGEAFAELGQWSKRAEVREQELILPEVNADKPRLAELARELATLYEEKLDDPEAAARALHRVDDAVGDLDAVRALRRIYESRQRFAEVGGAIERELQLLAPTGSAGLAPPERARILELWLVLGELRKSRLARPASAAEAYEQVIAIDPGHLEALETLASIYEALERPHDLERVLDLRAAAAADPRERAALLLQKGDLLEKSGDLEGALAALSDSFLADPASRAAFTAFERVCYSLERWGDAMRLYEVAIELVEVRKSRAYRLADLYARRGQVQQQYLGQPGEAAASYLRVLEIDPQQEAAMSTLERIFSGQGDWHGLLAAYERRADLLADDAARANALRSAARIAGGRLHDPKRAALVYERLHSVDPTDAEALEALERHYEGSRDWDRLIDILRTRIALATSPEDAVKLYQRVAALCEEGKHDPEQAIEAYLRILDLEPQNRSALESLGRLYEGTERWKELIEVTRQQIRLVADRSQKALLFFKCGSVTESKFGNEEDAIRYYDAAVRTSFHCLPAVHGLRDLHLRRKDYPAVIRSLELEAKLWTEDKERAGVLAHIGTIYAENLGSMERAIKYFEQALGVDKNCLAANRSLFEVYFARGDYVRAMPLAQVLTQKVMREGDPEERADFYRKRAIVARETGDLPSAAESLVVALEIHPENVEALELLVGLCHRHGEAWDFASTFTELEKLYRKRDAASLVARVLIGRGALAEREYDVDEAERLYREALELSPHDFPVANALAELHVRMRRHEAAAAVLDVFLGSKPGSAGAPGQPEARASAWLRLAAIHSEGAMDSRRAADALRSLIAEQPEHREAHHLLSQELYLLGAWAEARRVAERLLELATAPAATASPIDLARYYDYLGRIAEAMGDPGSAVRAFRRAVELDPACAPSVLALARRASQARDDAQVQALEEQGLAAAAGRSAEALARMQRGLARFHGSLGTPAGRARGAELYRQALARDPNHADDRVALAALHAAGAVMDPAGLRHALEELQIVLQRDVRSAAAYQLLHRIYASAGEGERAARVAAVLRMTGLGDPDETPATAASRTRKGALPEPLRRAHLLPPAALGAFGDALEAIREAAESGFPPPVLGDLQTIAGADPGLRQCVNEVARLFGVTAEVVVAAAVPGGAMAFDSPKPTVAIEAALALRSDGERRFLLGRAFDALRGGYALPLRLRPFERADLAHVLDQLLRPPGQRDPATQALVARLPRKAARAVERLADSGAPLDPVEVWYRALGEAADRAGLLACDDISGAIAALARLSGEEPERGLSLGESTGVPALVRFYLSDSYHLLRAGLVEATGS